MKVLVTQLCPTLRPHGLCYARLLCPWNFPGKNTRVGHHFLLQGLFPTQGSNPGHPQCRQILYCPSHQESYLFTWRKLYFVDKPHLGVTALSLELLFHKARRLAVLMSLKLNTGLQTFALKESKETSSKFSSNLYS